MESESFKTAPSRTSEELASHPSDQHRSHSHRNGGSRRSSQLAPNGAPPREVGGGGGDKMKGMQLNHHSSSSRHHHSRSHSHSHRHRHRSHHSAPSPAGGPSAHEGNSQKDTASEKENGRGGNGVAGSVVMPSTQSPCEASVNSRASTRSSRLPMRRSERASVVGPGSTFGEASLHDLRSITSEVSALDRPASHKDISQRPAALPSLTGFPAANGRSTMRETDGSGDGQAASGKQPAPHRSNRTASSSSSSYASQDGGSDFHAEAPRTTATTTTSNAAAAAAVEVPYSVQRDSGSSSPYDKAEVPAAARKEEEEDEESSSSRNSNQQSQQQQQQQQQRRRSLPVENGAAPASTNASASARRLVTTASSNGRSPQRGRPSSTSPRRTSTAIVPFHLNTERRGSVRRTASPQAYVPHDPLMDLPKEQRERIMAMPHHAFNAPGTWRLDMRYEEDRKEYFRQTYLVDPLTRTRPTTRQFRIPEQLDLFGMYPDIPMTKDEDGNDVVEHQAPIPIKGESFVKEQKPYAPPRVPRKQQQQRGRGADENLVYAPPPPRPSTTTAAAAAGRPSPGLSDFVWGYGEESCGRPGGLTPPRGRIVSDITAPYRRNPAMSTGQIGQQGGAGTLNLFHTPPSEEHERPGNNTSKQQQQRQRQSGLVGTPPQSSLDGQQTRDVSQASTSFAIMQPTPFPSTTNSDYGRSPRRGTEAAAVVGVTPSSPPLQAPSDHVETDRPAEDSEVVAAPEQEAAALEKPQSQQHPPSHNARSPPAEAVVLRPSVGGNSGSQSPSDGVVAPPRGTDPVAEAKAPTAVQPDEFADRHSGEKNPVDEQPPAQAAKVPKVTSPPDATSLARSNRSTAKSETSRRLQTSEGCKPQGEKKEEGAPAAKPAVKPAAQKERLQKQQQQPPHSAAPTEKSERAAVNAQSSVVPSSAASTAGAQVDDTAALRSTSSSPVSVHKSTPAPSPSSSAKAATAAAAPVPPPQLSHVPAANTAVSSEVQTPKSARPDTVFPVPSPAPTLPASVSSRVSRERDERVKRPSDTAAAPATVSNNNNRLNKDDETTRARPRTERPSRASAPADVPPPLPSPPPSTPRTAASTAVPASATTKTRPSAAVNAATLPSTAPSSNAYTREASSSTTDGASAHEEHYDPSSTGEEVGAPTAASAAPSHRSAAAASPVASSRRSETKAGESSRRSEDQKEDPPNSRPTPTPTLGTSVASSVQRSSVGRSSSHRHGHGGRSVRSEVSAASSSAPESEASSSAFSSRQHDRASGAGSPAASSKDHLGSSSYAGGPCEKPVVSGCGTQTDFVFVLDPLQGRQFLQLEQEQQLFLEEQQLQQQKRPQNVLQITDTRFGSSGILTNYTTPPRQQQQETSSNGLVSPSQQRAAGVSTGVSPTCMRRTSYANMSTNVRDLLRWS
ncbi:hypothetical protein ABB37_08454 [Leptomonas pyrrhocoris]|uniref:Uncharacterized protein n=1 Tax=Leptomonas pyrrhocoris TaxID=157538 RepID=A0A0N0DS91_LEPPY|nr:hypothetical protein ABB37_08454 [Leptomonas pyrrhocoris]KPA75572.1 hypothetical protein ABB37_08454 [Leptomonas pyrrhocoris]|eukprot:XP_015654011.1 hypothetical protein ABB37_08454 [Leptomonas pyrrhocoris]